MIKFPTKPLSRPLTVKGVGNAISNIVNPIPYRIIAEDGDWAPYFGTSVEERQKFGQWDSNDCWEFSPTKQLEMQFNALYKRGEFSEEAVKFFKKTGIVDSNGFFNISDQFYDCLSGLYGNGGTAAQYFNLVQEYGIIPHYMLFCTDAIANGYASQKSFDSYYYNRNNVTDAMLAIGQESLKYFQLRYKRIGSIWNTPDDTALTTAIKQAPLAYGVPVDVMKWNQYKVPSLVLGVLNHEVTGYKAFQGMDSYPIIDNYNPFIKTLQKPYSLNLVTQGIITAIPAQVTSQNTQTTWDKVWSSVNDYLTKIGIIRSVGKISTPQS